MRALRFTTWIRGLNQTWRGARLSRAALGKYIVLCASLLHVTWAILLLVSPLAGGSTPVHIVVVVCGGPVRTALVLTVVAVLALVFPFSKHIVSNRSLAGMLIPQQAVLLMSAGAGIRAAWMQHYADGVVRSWTFILSDQFPVILIALVYTVAVIETAFEK